MATQKNMRILLVLALVINAVLVYLFLKFENFSLLSHHQSFSQSTRNSSGLGRFNVTTSPKSNSLLNGNLNSDHRQSVNLIVIVSTAPERSERREQIRKTYWRYCHDNPKVRCYFFTDGNVSSNVLRNIGEENQYNNDMIFQPLAGREFGLRFLYQIRWVMSHFNFNYLLRADDDYFICLNRLIYELEDRPRHNLVWGYFYCKKDPVLVDEAFMIFTKDIIERFFSQDEKKMLCHPHAGQQIALWLNDIPSRIYFNDKRLHHYPRASQTNQFNDVKYKICDRYLGIYGALGEKMSYFDKISNDSRKEDMPEIKKHRSSCQYKGFDWSKIGGGYNMFEPAKPCVDKSNWSLGDEARKGAEGGVWWIHD